MTGDLHACFQLKPGEAAGLSKDMVVNLPPFAQMTETNSYDNFAAEYQSSKQLPFRSYVEWYSLSKLLGPVEGLSILDLACGDGIYTRRLRESGAARVLGIDLSGEMIALAREQEECAPLGCEYEVGDAASLGIAGEFDIVMGAYLLNYANSTELLSQFAKTIFSNLKPGGRFLGINDNPAQEPSAYPLCRKYGFTKTSKEIREAGDPITYEITTPAGEVFSFDNYYLDPDTFPAVFKDAGFSSFRWEGPWLAPDAHQSGEGFWDHFMSDPPIVGVVAEC